MRGFNLIGEAADSEYLLDTFGQIKKGTENCIKTIFSTFLRKIYSRSLHIPRKAIFCVAFIWLALY